MNPTDYDCIRGQHEVIACIDEAVEVRIVQIIDKLVWRVPGPIFLANSNTSSVETINTTGWFVGVFQQPVLLISKYIFRLSTTALAGQCRFT